MYQTKPGQYELIRFLIDDLEPRYHKTFPDFYGNAGYAKPSLTIEDVIQMMEDAIKTGVQIPYAKIYDFDVDEVKALEARGVPVDL